MALLIGDLLSQARQWLGAARFRPSPREASLLLGRVLGLSEAQVLARMDDEISAGAAARFRHLLQRRLAGEPVAYLFDEKEFYGRSFYVDRRVLIPRPETEHLVEAVLEQELPPDPLCLDIGTGSGCIAITLALERPSARVLATDISAAALAVAARNVRRHGVAGQVLLAGVELLEGIRPSRFDLVVSNPPYVDRRGQPRLSPEVEEYEPSVALFAPGDGESVLRQLIAASRTLRPGVPVLLEIGQGQTEAVARLTRRSTLSLKETRDDYAGIPRVVVLHRR